jgi:hypothetical protein
LVLGWQGDYYPWLIFLLAVESLYTVQVIRRRMLDPFDIEWWLYRGSEWVVITLLMKLLLYFVNGFEPFLADLRSWQENFSLFFDYELLFLLISGWLLWGITGTFEADLFRLQTRPSDTMWEDAGDFELDRLATRQQIFSRIFGLGIVMVIMAAMVRQDIEMIFGKNPGPHTQVWYALVYFGLSLALMSQTQFAQLHGRWYWERIQISPGVARRWFWASLVLMVGLIGLVFLLPTGYSVNLLELVRLALNLAAYALFLVFSLILTVITTLLLPLLALLGIGNRTGEEAAAPFDFDLPMQPALPGGEIPWLEVLKSLLFWLVFIGGAILAGGQYLRQNQELWSAIRRLRLVQWVGRAWDWLRLWLKQANRELNQTVGRGLAAARQRLQRQTAFRPAGAFSLRRLSPRERVIFYYLALVRRGGEQGLERQVSQTPYQYAETLRTSLPEAVQPDLSGITGTFVEARYSQHPVDAQQVGITRQAWEHLRAALRHIGRRKTG